MTVVAAAASLHWQTSRRKSLLEGRGVIDERIVIALAAIAIAAVLCLVVSLFTRSKHADLVEILSSKCTRLDGARVFA